MAVKKSFSKAILHNKSLSKEKDELMVDFMLSNIELIFRVNVVKTRHSFSEYIKESNSANLLSTSTKDQQMRGLNKQTDITV